MKSWGYKNSIVTLKRLWIHCVIPVYAPTKAPYFCFMLYLNFQRHLFCLALYINYHILLISLRLGLVLKIKELYAFILIFRLQFIMPGTHVQSSPRARPFIQKQYCLEKYVWLLFKNVLFWTFCLGLFMLDDFDFIFYHPICGTYYIVDTQCTMYAYVCSLQ